MEIKYNPEDDSVDVTIMDQTERMTVKDLLGHLTPEKTRLEWLLSEIHRTRSEKIKNLGNYMDIIINLMKGEAGVRKKMEDQYDLGNYKAVKALGEVVKAYLAQKNTVNEFRHAQKFLTNEEGRLMAFLAKIEV